MSITVNEFNEFIEDMVPSFLKEDYDNVGHLVGDGEDKISGVLASLDCSLDAIDKAIELNYNLILTHHPLIFRRPDSVTTSTLQGKKIIKLIKNSINHYAIHTNLDSISFGMNKLLVMLLGFSNEDIIEKGYFQDSGLGRIVTINEGIRLDDLLEKVKTVGKNSIKFAGDSEKVLHKIAIINGAGQDFIFKSIDLGADCIITADTTYHHVKDASELGLTIIDMGHYESENLPFKEFIKHLREELFKKNIDLDFYYHECKPVYDFYH